MGTISKFFRYSPGGWVPNTEPVFKVCISQKNQTITRINYKRAFWKFFAIEMMRVRIVSNIRSIGYLTTLYSSSSSFSFEYTFLVNIVKSSVFVIVISRDASSQKWDRKLGFSKIYSHT